MLADMKISPDQLSSEQKEKIGDYSRKMQQELAQLYEKKRKERDGGAGSSAEAPQPPPTNQSVPRPTVIQQQVSVTRPDEVISRDNMVPAPQKYQSVHSYQPSPLRPRTPLSVVPMRSGTVRSVGGGTSQYYPSHCGGLTSFPVSVQQHDQVLHQSPGAGGRLSLPQSQAYQLRNMSRMPFRMQTRSTLSFTQPQQLGPRSDRLRPMAPRMGPVSSQLHPSPSLMGPQSPQLDQQPPQMQPVFLQMQPRMPSQPQTVSNQPPQVKTIAIERWPLQSKIVGGHTSQYYPSQSGSAATSQHQRNQAIYKSHGAGGWLPQPQPQPYQLNNMLMMHSRPPQQLVSMSDRLQPQPSQMDIVSPQLHQSPPQMEAQSPQLAPLPPQLELWSPDQMLFPELHLEPPLMEPVSPQLHQSPPQMKPLSPQLDDLPPLWSPDQMLFPELYPEPSMMDPVSPQFAPLSPELDLWSSQMLPPMALQPETMSNQPPHAEKMTIEQQPQAPQLQIGGNNTTVSAPNIEGFIPPPDGVNPTDYDDLLEDHEELWNSVAEIMGPDFFGV